MGSCGALMPFLHLPVQSGSDRILAAMNRKHTAADYLGLIGAHPRHPARISPSSSDFIVGFPGETEDGFQPNPGACAKQSDSRRRFPSSIRRGPGTPGAALPQVDEAIKRDRLARLQAVLERQRQAFNAAAVGRTVDVLFEKAGRRAGQIGGRTPHMHAVHVDADAALIGTVQSVEIVSVGPNSLYGRLADHSAIARGPMSQ